MTRAADACCPRMLREPDGGDGDWARVPLMLTGDATYPLAGRRSGAGGLRSAIARFPRSLREKVCPEVRLETPPRMPTGRATASGHRAVLRHEAKLEGGWNGPNELRKGVRGTAGPAGETWSHHQPVAPRRQAPEGRRAPGATAWEYDIVPTVEANGNKPISPLSVAADPRCAC